MKRITQLLVLTLALSAKAQQKILTEEQFLSAIARFHPVAKQTAIDIKIAKASILSSRGEFDPQWISQANRKEFGGTTYYDQQVHEVQIPTWYGLDLFAGVEKITGDRVNPEDTKGSIAYMGISIQPLQNLLIDKRRAALSQARNFYQLSKVEQRLALNDLIKQALRSYWNWWEKYQVQNIIKVALANAEKRLDLVKTAFKLGDRPAIDTLEAFTQTQAFQIRLVEASQNLVKANLELSTFLWDDNGQVDLPFDAVPQDFTEVNSLELNEILNITAAHPKLLEYEYRLKNLQIDRRLAFQSLLPALKLKYNQLGYNFPEAVKADWFNNNYRFGLSLSVPLRLSQGRGEYQEAKLEIERTQLDQANTFVRLYATVKQYFAEWQQREKQLSLQLQLLGNTTSLLRAEELRFTNGESSLFIINARELKMIEAQQQGIELQAKARLAVIDLKWSAGILGF